MLNNLTDKEEAQIAAAASEATATQTSIRRIKVVCPEDASPGEEVEFTASNGETYTALVPMDQRKGKNSMIIAEHQFAT